MWCGCYVTNFGEEWFSSIFGQKSRLCGKGMGIEIEVGEEVRVMEKIT
jgi:hypothetical protein